MKANLVLPAALGLLVVTLVAIALAGGASAEPTFRAVRLSPNAPDGVAKAALSYTRAYMRVLSGVPEVVYVGPVNSAGLPGVGLQEMDSPNPLVLAIVKADVDIAGAFPMSVIDADTRYNYVCYVFDCETGLPMQIYAERNGDVLRRVLNPAERLNPPKPPPPEGNP